MPLSLDRTWQRDQLEDSHATGFGLLIVPAEVDLSPDMKSLRWTLNTEDSFVRTVAAQAGILESFTRLRDGPPESIRDFARQWGILRICKHGLPATHSNSPYGSVYFGEDSSFVLNRYPYCHALGATPPGDDKGHEPVSAWQFFARHAWALLNVIAKLNQDEEGRASEWEILYEHSHQGVGRDLVQQRLDCAAIVNTWLRVADVTPKIGSELRGGGVDFARYTIEFATDIFRGSTLFSYIACQLMTALLGTDIGLCAGCGEIYIAQERKPKRGQNNYCRDCGKKAAVRAAVARLRASPEYQQKQKRKRKTEAKKR